MKFGRKFISCLGADRGAVALAVLLLGWVAPAQAVPISQSPVASTRSADVKPNIMLLMDTSDSMGFTHMPDEVEDLVTPVSVGYKNYQCNPLYFNPTTNYLPPRSYNGDEFLASETQFGAAPYDIFRSKTTGTPNMRDLSTAFQAYEIASNVGDPQTVKQPFWNDDPKQAAYYYLYSGPLAVTLDFTSPVCRNIPNGQPTQDALDQNSNVVGTWTRVTVGAAKQQSFANWYSYYRTRMLMMKTAVSRSFNSLNDNRRVGFVTMEPTRDSAIADKVNPDKFLPVNDFTLPLGGQREAFYKKLFAQVAKGFSPAREGLARVGRYYGGQEDGINSGMAATSVNDPVQYSCQQNYTIMTTDGYWNAQTETKDSNISPFRGGPVQLDGKNLVASTSPLFNPDGTLNQLDSVAGVGNINVVPYGVWDGTEDQQVTTRDRTRVYSDNFPCTVRVNQYNSVQTVGQLWKYTTQQSTTTRTRDQWLSDSFHFEYERDNYAQILYRWHKHSDLKSWQTISYSLDRTQRQRREVPFTTQTTKYYYTTTAQWQESTYQEKQTITYWDKQETDQYRTSVTQRYAETSRQELTTAQYKAGERVREKQLYTIIRYGDSEFGQKTDSCTPGGAITCDLHHVNSNDAWFAVDPNQCTTDAPPSSSNLYIGTECRWRTITSFAPVTSCSPINQVIVLPNHHETTCTYTTLTGPSPAADPGCGTTYTATSSDHTVYICDTIPIAAAHHVPSCTTGFDSNTPYVKTICTDGPLAEPEHGGPPCSGPTNLGNDATRNCIHNPSVVTYVPPGTCNGSPSVGPNWDPNVVCTPGTASTDFVYAACSPTTLGTSGTSNARDVTCSGQINATGPGFVDTCAYPVGTTPETNSPYTRHVCAAGPLTNYGANSAACVNNQRTQIGQPADHAYRTCHLDDQGETYYPPSNSCPAHVADSSNGYDITCNTPSASAFTDDACTDAGVHGSGSGQFTVECGGRTLTSIPTTPCNNGETNTDGSGVTSTCVVVLGARTNGWGGSACTSAGDFTTYRCNLDPREEDLNRACVAGDTTSDSFVDSTCAYVPDSTAITQCNNGTTFDNSTRQFTSCVATIVAQSTHQPGGCRVGGPRLVDGIDYETCTRVDDNLNQPAAVGCSTSPVEDTNHNFTQCRNAYGYTDFPSSQSACQLWAAAHPDVTTTCSTSGSPVPSGVCVPTGPHTTDVGSTPGHDAYVTDECLPPLPASAGEIGVDRSNCGLTDGNGVTTILCHDLTSGPTDSTCAPFDDPATVNNRWTHTWCQANGGLQTGNARGWIDSETVDVHRRSGGINTTLISHSVNPLFASGSDDNYSCHLPNVLPPLPLPGPAPLIAGCTAWPCDDTPVALPQAGSINSVADVAQWYWANDLRTGVAFPNTGDNSVPVLGSGALDDKASWQHMTTFVIALGASGNLKYVDNYRNPAGDFADILTGAKRWPVWPDPAINYAVPGAYDDPRSIDDFWHTAVNGRGQFFSARDPQAVANGVSNALIGIQGATAAGAAAGITSPEPTVGNNTAYITSYRTYDWYGDVEARAIDVSSGAFTSPAGVKNWSAAALLAQRIGDSCDNRTIYLMRSTGASSTLVDFTLGSSFCNNSLGVGTARADQLNAAELPNFDRANAINNLSQYPQMTDGSSGSENQRDNATGAALVNFIRGQHFHEGFIAGDHDKFFRTRHGVLGDIVDAQPVYVKAPFADYAENDYSQYKIDKSTRAAMVYVAANDGMLHAFNASTVLADASAGKEEWAVIPSPVLPNLWRLADENYANQHQFYVDQTPTVGDVYSGSGGANGWSTLLVGGLNAGGRGYYALDITDPLNPVARWEFKLGSCYVNGNTTTYGADCNLGLSFGKPLITKLTNGKWVVMFTSGYNNNSPGDGVGYLYVLDALTGQIISRISTGVGDATTPSNLGQINAYVDDALTNNTTLRVYGGDMLGYVWRFDVNNNQPPAGIEALQLTRTLDPMSNPQPITTRPELAEIDGKPMVFVATGRLLATADVADHQVQSIYGIVDPLTQTTAEPVIAGTLRSTLKKLTMAQSIANGNKIRTVTCNTGDNCTSTAGWFIDLPDVGERVNVDMQLVLGTLVVASNVPDTNACSVGGYSWFNYFDFKSGEAVTGTPNNRVSEFLSSALVTGFNVIKVASGIEASVRMSNATSKIVGLQPPPLTPQAKRISWREIPQ